MAVPFEHERIRELEDRDWTLALLDEVRSTDASEAEREEALQTLSYLEDYRSIPPLTGVVEDDQLPASLREYASDVLRGFDDATTPERRRAWWATGDPVIMAHALRMMARSEADVVARVASDDEHPLQAVALRAMTFGFDEAEFQPVKIRALGHRDPEMREAAADVLLWDEPVAAEEPLLNAASDPSSDVAAAAVDTLQYYPSRRVLRAVADMTDVEDDQVRARAAETFASLRERFELCAGTNAAEASGLLREWMEPVADLLRSPEEVEDREGYSPPVRRPPPTLSGPELLALLDAGGEWATKKRTLRDVSWDGFGEGERERLSEALSTHPDPVVRDVAATPLAAWARTDDLVRLTSDPSFSVRKSAMYHLAFVPPDPALAVFARQYMLDAAETTAYEALQTYVAHAEPAEAVDWLTDIALTDPRESVRTTAISYLAVDLAAVGAVEQLVALLDEPPAVTWAVHICVLDGLRKLGIAAPGLDDLAAVDNLGLFQSVAFVRCAAR